jgi:hypothetical protein
MDSIISFDNANLRLTATTNTFSHRFLINSDILGIIKYF